MIDIILIIAVLSYREVGILCQRRSWDFKAFKYIYWQTNQTNFWKKNFDWFHISNGIVVLIGCHLINSPLDSIHWLTGSFDWVNPFLITVLEWFSVFYIRNVWMHVILPRWDSKSPQLRLWYLVPLAGGFLDNKFRKK